MIQKIELKRITIDELTELVVTLYESDVHINYEEPKLLTNPPYTIDTIQPDWSDTKVCPDSGVTISSKVFLQIAKKLKQLTMQNNWPKKLNTPDFLAFVEFLLRSNKLNVCVEGICESMEEIGITAEGKCDSHCERTNQIIATCEKEGMITTEYTDWPTPKVEITELGYEQINKDLLKDYFVSLAKIQKELYLLARTTKETKALATEYSINLSQEDISCISGSFCETATCYNKAVAIAPNNKPMCEECLYEIRFPANKNKEVEKIIRKLQKKMDKCEELEATFIDQNSLASKSLQGKISAYAYAIKLLTKLDQKEG